MRCTVVHCTLTACLQGEFWRNGTKVQMLMLMLWGETIWETSWSLLHFDIFHVRDFIPTTSWNPLCEVSSSSAPIHCKGFAIILSSQQIQHIGERDDAPMRYLLLSIPQDVDMWTTFAYINRPADRVRGHETEISVGNTQMFVLKSKNRPVVLDFEAVVTNPSGQPNSL